MEISKTQIDSDSSRDSNESRTGASSEANGRAIPGWVIVIGLVAAVFAVYGASLANGFVWDDTALVLRDPLIRSWRLIPEGFRHFLFTDATASNFYRPIQRLTFTFDYLLWGFSPLFYHLTNLLIHAGASVALFGFLFELTRKRALAASVALIWAIHPINSSAVIYIAGRADPLAALFGFGALWLALRNRAGLAAGSFLLALLSKESAFAFLLIWGLILVFQRRALAAWILLLPPILCAYGLLRLGAEHVDPPRFAQPAPLAARPILVARSAALYAGLSLFPANLTMERDLVALKSSTTPEQARNLEYLTLAGLALLVAAGFWIASARNPQAVLCAGCAWVAYLPISNLLPLNATFAEHWFYVPGAFLFAALALDLEGRPWLRNPKARKAGLALFWCWALFLGGRTFLRNEDWKDARTFFTRTILAGGSSSRMWSNLGGVELKEGHPQKALACYRKAMESPQPFALLGLASAEIKLKDYNNARAHLEEAFRTPFVRPEVLASMAALDYQESGKDRIELLWEAADIAPENWAIQKKYILHMAERGQIKEAIDQLKMLLESQWWRAESWKTLGDLLTKNGEDASEAYQKAASLDVRLSVRPL